MGDLGGFQADVALEAGPGNEVQVKFGCELLRASKPPDREEESAGPEEPIWLELRTHDVDSETVARMG